MAKKYNFWEHYSKWPQIAQNLFIIVHYRKHFFGRNRLTSHLSPIHVCIKSISGVKLDCDILPQYLHWIVNINVLTLF